MEMQLNNENLTSVGFMFALIGLILIVTTLIVLFVRRNGVTPDQSSRIAALETEINALREVKSQLDSQLAAERVRANRIPELEGALDARTAKFDDMQIAKGILETQFATATEALARVEATLKETQGRLTQSVEAVASSGVRMEALRLEKGRVDEALATAVEALNVKSLATVTPFSRPNVTP